MRRRPLLAALTGVATGLSGCTALVGTSDRDDGRESTEAVDEPPDTGLPDGEPTAVEVLGDPRDDADPHVVVVRNGSDPRNVEVRVSTGEDGTEIFAEAYALARDEHVRIELHEPAEYAVGLYEQGDPVGEPVEIAADWFEYDCPATVIVRGAGDRLTASTRPDTDAC